jgi:dUTP pyrophosphatase
MAAALDLYACIDGPLALEAQANAQLVPAGVALHIADPQVAALIVPRSGLGHRRGLVLGNSIGVVDADYTGPVLVSLWNRNALGTEPIVIAPGDRVAQMLFVPILRPELSLVSEFSRASERGAGGFGSTG